MERPALQGSKSEFDALVEWLTAMTILRERLQEESDVNNDERERIRLLTRRLTQAENRLRAVIGSPPLL